MRNFLYGLLPGMLFATLSICAYAKVSPEAAKALDGPELTPVGAVRAGSKDGQIPEWNGALSKEEAQIVGHLAPGAFYPDIFPGDKVLFRIDHTNVAKYGDKLPAGTLALLNKYPDYFLNVYATRRTAMYPAAIYAATRENAVSATLDSSDGLQGAKIGFPFPIPANGSEVIWNHKLRYRGDSVQQMANYLVVSANGDFQQSTYAQTAQFFYGSLSKDADRSVLLKMVRRVLSPPRLAGQLTLIIDYTNSARDAWLYSSSTSRVLQAPTVQYDAPIASTDGLEATDQADMFNGSMSQYTWKLLGKKEMYIPYNGFKLIDPKLKYSKIIQKKHLNPNYLRYELHRVWVVEANLKPGSGNQIKRRMFYVDEDSWTIAAVDCYDSRNQLWRFEEGFVLSLPREKLTVAAPEVVYDISSGRYVVQSLPNEWPYFAKFNVPVSPEIFTPQHLKQQADDTE